MALQSRSRLYYRVTGDRKVYIYKGLAQLALIKGAEAVDFIGEVAKMIESQKQDYIKSFLSKR